jgi:hypothetical protein
MLYANRPNHVGLTSVVQSLSGTLYSLIFFVRPLFTKDKAVHYVKGGLPH